jgi:hypothetical protein
LACHLRYFNPVLEGNYHQQVRPGDRRLRPFISSFCNAHPSMGCYLQTHLQCKICVRCGRRGRYFVIKTVQQWQSLWTWSTYFIVPKKDGDLQLILNLKRFNVWIQSPNNNLGSCQAGPMVGPSRSEECILSCTDSSKSP